MGERLCNPGEWNKVSEILPPLELPVWIFLPEIGQPVIGCRSDDGEGWLWCQCWGYSAFWYDRDEKAWRVDDAEADDYNPTHWMYLPDPPVTE